MADLSLISDAAWREAQRRAEVIRPLAELERRPRAEAHFGTSLQSTLENDTFPRACCVS
jgi:hypothetical protein